MASSNTDIIISRILRDIEVEYSDEFDRNFQRQGFFNEAWERRHSPLRPGGATLVDTGRLRRSFHSETNGNVIKFVYDAPYGELHNEGGTIKVTERMKKFFWAKMYAAQGSFGRRKNGSPSHDKRTVKLTTEAAFWKFMALKKVGTEIRIPQRKFVGCNPQVEDMIKKIIHDNLTEYFNVEFKIDTK